MLAVIDLLHTGKGTTQMGNRIIMATFRQAQVAKYRSGVGVVVFILGGKPLQCGHCFPCPRIGLAVTPGVAHRGDFQQGREPGVDAVAGGYAEHLERLAVAFRGEVELALRAGQGAMGLQGLGVLACWRLAEYRQ